MRRLATALGWVAVSLVFCAAAAAEPVHVTILHVNDWDRMEEADGRGGAARVAALLAAERAAGDHVLVTHGGDALSPSLLAAFDQGAHMVDLLNGLDLDAFVPGNHDFDFGPDVAQQRFAEADFPIVASSIRTSAGAPMAGTVDSLLVEVGGFTLGIFGLTTTGATITSDTGDLVFLDELETAERLSASLREQGADLVVALAHLRLFDDLALARSGLVDVILSGDDHLVLNVYDGRTVLVEAGSQAETVVALDLSLERVEQGGEARVVWRPSVRMLDTAAYAPDPEMAARVQGYLDGLSAELDVEIGHTETELDSTRPAVRGGEAAIGNLVADAMRQAVGADIAITNGGGIRAERVYPPGTVLTRRDIVSELPFGSRTVLLEVTGGVVRAALEHGLTAFEASSGRFPHVSALRVAYDPEAPAGQRVREVLVDGAPLDDAATYTLATNDFLAGGGDGYAMFVDLPRIVGEIDGQLMASQVIDYVTAAGAIAPTVEGRLGPAE